MLTRFIAFAYTYHYLNWFSKTSVIRWHDVPQARLLGTVGLWVLAVGLYAFDFQLGLAVLGMLGLLHVFLEFPLNWQCLLGIHAELAAIGRHGWTPSAGKRPRMQAGKRLAATGT
jgi:hypothetical protein